jgi:hypothetical protein
VSKLLDHVASVLQAEMEGEYTPHTLAEAAVNAVIGHLGAPTDQELAALANSFHPEMDPRSATYLARHFQRMLAESLP